MNTIGLYQKAIAFFTWNNNPVPAANQPESEVTTIQALPTAASIQPESLDEHTNIYEDLTPIDTLPNDSCYNDVLKWAMANDKIKNIALTGPYGSGKSSILRTFEKENTNFNYLNISLASFREAKSDESEDKGQKTESTTEESRLIELSILQQMFYKVRDSDIPDSRFTRIKILSDEELEYNTTIGVLGLLAVYLLFKPETLTGSSWWPQIQEPYQDLILLLPFLFLLPGITQILKYLLRLFNTSKFNKLNLTSGEIEFNPKSETSILNKHLDEILYFFEVTAYDIVVIEDLDRFNDPEIFTKLREINILLNNSLQIGRKIVFIYAIKDDMFKDKTRTKFFDFLVPVIPVINSTNSFEIMKKKVNMQGLNLNISEKFLGDITLYIDDMRALKNIFNEFIIYKKTLKDINIKADKLFAMVVYKNIYPNDFADLHADKGDIYEIFTSKPALIKQEISKKEERIASIQERISQIDALHEISIEELRQLYLFKLTIKIPKAVALSLEGKRIEWTELDTDTNFKILKKETNINYFYYHMGYNSEGYTQLSNISFKKFEAEVDAEKSYDEREAILLEKLTGKTDSHKKEVERLKREISELKTWSIKSILEAIPDAQNSFSDNIREKKLLMYLIREGYIDEMYASIISYFYEGSLSKNDMQFLLSITDREPLAYDYALPKVTGIMPRLSIQEFKRTAILNINMVDYLISNISKYQKEFDEICIQLGNKSERSISFIDSYLATDNPKPYLLQSLCSSWKDIAEFIFFESDFSDKKRDNYLRYLIKQVDIADLVRINHEQVLSEYVSTHNDFLSLIPEKEYQPKLKDLIKQLKVKFKSLPYENESSTELLDFIYQGNYYEVNEAMINLWIKLKGARDEAILNSLKTGNYTAITDSTCTDLIQYLDANMKAYIKNVFLPLPDNHQESESSVIKLLNHPDIPDEEKIEIIRKQDVCIENISDVVIDQWINLFDNQKIAVKWVNVIELYENGENIAVITQFLNQKEVYETLSKSHFNKEIEKPKELFYKFSRALILNSDLSDESFEALAKSIPYYYNSLAFGELSLNKIETLIDLRVIKLTKEIFELLKTKFESRVPSLIEKNIATYLATPDDFPLDASAYTSLLNSVNISIEKKSEIIRQIDADVLISDEPLANLVGSILAINPWETIDYTILKSIITFSSSIMDCTALFNFYLVKLQPEQVDELLKLMGEPYSAIAERGKKPKLSKSGHNEFIVRKLKDLKYISSYKIDDDKIKVNTFNKE